MEIKIATRKSPLALYQAEAVKKAIIDKHPDCICELIPLDSEGDKDLRPIHELGGKGVFVKRLEEALVMGDADIAVHVLLVPQPTAPRHGPPSQRPPPPPSPRPPRKTPQWATGASQGW